MPVAPGDWSRNAFSYKINVGKYSPTNSEGRLFKGKIACLQLYDKSLSNAEVVKSMSNCYEKTKLQNDKSYMRCPDGWEFYQDNCYQISVTNMPFRRAEVKCINSVRTKSKHLLKIIVDFSFFSEWKSLNSVTRGQYFLVFLKIERKKRILSCWQNEYCPVGKKMNIVLLEKMNIVQLVKLN